VEQSLKVTNLKLAIEKARLLDEALQRGDYAGLLESRQKRHMTMREFMEEFRASYTGWKRDPAGRDTFVRNESLLANIEIEFGDLPLSVIGTGDIQRWLGRLLNEGSPQAEKAGRKKKPLSRASVNRHRSCLSTLLRVAVEWGLLYRNPVRDVPMLKEEQKIPEGLSPTEVEKLMVVLRPHDKFATLMFLYTGMREQELFSLRWQDIDFHHRQIVVRKSKPGEFRVIPMTPQVEEALLTWRAHSSTEHVFMKADGSRMTNIKKPLREAARRAGIPHVHQHRLRHTFATALRELGVPLDRIQELLGHKSITMTMRYAKATPTQLEGAMATLGESNAFKSFDANFSPGTSRQNGPDRSGESEPPSRS